ncbi:MAG: hypothetical protein Q9218_000743 [Villophora microphyllina]
MAERNKSLRRKKQPDAGIVESPDLSSDAVRFLPLSANSQVTGARNDAKSRQVESFYEHTVQPEIPQQTYSTRSLSPIDDPQPPESMIGVALGSPGHSPLPSLPPDEASWTCVSPDQKTQASSRSSDKDALRSTGSRWRTLGGLLGKRSGSGQQSTTASRDPDYSPRMTRPQGVYDQALRNAQSTTKPKVKTSITAQSQNHHSWEWIGPAHLPVPEICEKKNYLLRKTSLRRNHLTRKQTQDGETTGMPRTREQHPVNSKSGAVGEKEGNNALQPKGQLGSLLQVEIPNIELERYSVMFSSLLQPSQQSIPNRPSSPKRQPSLLARRQVNVPELKTTKPPSIERPWMHDELSSSRHQAASPNRASSPNRSPSFSLFPPSPPAHGRKANKQARERSPLHRSASTPIAVSPSKAKFEFFDTSDNGRQDQVILIVHTPSEPSESRRQSGMDFYTPPTSLHTPHREISTNIEYPFPSLSPSQNADPSHLASSSNARTPSPSRPPNTNKPSPHPMNTYNKAAEISIARQISISRQQRQLLVPSGMPTKVVPQPVQPKIVDPSQQRQRGNSREERKSQRVVLEHA